MENQKTLLSITEHPLRTAAKFGISAKQLASKLLSFSKNGDSVSPDDQALRFYSLNQIVGAMSTRFTPNEKLPKWGELAVSLYNDELLNQHRRMFWYTFLVVSREWRHLHNLGTVSAVKSHPYTPGLKALHATISDSCGEDSLNKWLKNVPDMYLADYLDCITHSFNTGTWGGGYGGKKWGEISQTLLNYVSGKISAEVFIDTAYTLAHNNGPMFNKGMLYDQYTSTFKTILDVQRGGQVCEALIEGEFKLKDGKAIGPVLSKCRESLGFGTYVDWYKVESLGALQQYPHKKVAQDKLHKKATPTLVGGKPIKVVGEFEWYPGKSVDIFERMTA